jgi:hypothetical protein
LADLLQHRELKIGYLADKRQCQVIVLGEYQPLPTLDFEQSRGGG